MVAASEDHAIRDLEISISDYPELQSLVDTSAPVIITNAARNSVVADVRELAKRFGGEESGQFVNGILDLAKIEAGRFTLDDAASVCARGREKAIIGTITPLTLAELANILGKSASVIVRCKSPMIIVVTTATAAASVGVNMPV